MMSGLSQLETRLRECGRSFLGRGKKAMMTITVAPNGKIASITTGNTGLDQCLFNEARGVSFPATRIGGQAIMPLDIPWI